MNKVWAGVFIALQLSACSILGGGDDKITDKSNSSIGACYAGFMEGKYEQAAQACSGLDDPQALYNMAWMYSRGKGVELNYSKAAYLMEHSARLNYVPAQHDLAVMYDGGIGVTQSYHNAFKWYQAAAGAGDLASMNALSSLYYCGDGVAVDYDQSLVWALRAASADSAAGMYQVGRLLEENKIKKEQVFDSKPINWYKRAADLQYPEAMFILAKKDYEKSRQKGQAVRQMEQAAYLGSVSAALYLGDLSAKGGLKNRINGGLNSAVAAYCWYNLAEHMGSAAAMEKIKKLTKNWNSDKLVKAKEQCGD